MVDNVCGLSLVGFHLRNCKIDRLVFVSVSPFFVPHFGMSAWRLKCTKRMGLNSDVVQGRIYVRTEGGCAEEIR